MSRCLSIFFGILGIVTAAQAVDTQDTRLLSSPAVSRAHIVFGYAGDLYRADRDGGAVVRLTSVKGRETDPVFSPDGQWISFTGEYDGNQDVFIMPVSGGTPRRMTWHPTADVPLAFRPDGKALLFRSPRSVFTGRHQQIFTLALQNGIPENLGLPRAFRAAYSPDSRHLAYTPLGERFREWKHYRGGTVTTIWIHDLNSRQEYRIPQPEDRCNDTYPMWVESKVYFLSDRGGEFNLYSYDVNSKVISQLTDEKDFPILSAAAAEDVIIYEQAGALHLFDLASGKTKQLKIGVAVDLPELRSRYASGFRYVRDAAISPSGKRAAVAFRGEIVTVPAENGDPRNISQSPGAHDQGPAWSPDGRSIAYFSDAFGEYALVIQSQEGLGTVKSHRLNGTGFYTALAWSPDSKKLTYADNGRHLYWMDTETGRVVQIDQEPMYNPGVFGSIQGEWSHDSNWITYTRHTPALMEQVWIYSVSEKKSYPVTDGMSSASSPVFDESGKYLFFFASTDAGPVKHWFAQSNADMEATQAIYLVTLQKETPNPFAKESDEEKGAIEEKILEPKSDLKDENKEAGLNIDFEDIAYRIVAIPGQEGNYSQLQSGKSGQIYYVETVDDAGPGDRKLHKYDLESRKDNVIHTGVFDYEISHDRKSILYFGRNSLFITALSDKIEPGKGQLKMDAVRVRVEPATEWQQIFDEAWRINRDYFYDPNFHGADWPAMKEKYAPFLKDLSCRDDLNRVIQWMCSELGVGHHRGGGGDTGDRPERIPGGLLGADYEVSNGRYQFSKVYGGLNWNPELRSPLKAPGVIVKEGEYLLAVNGVELKAPENLYNRFEYTAGTLVELTVGPRPDGHGSRKVMVTPLPDEWALRNRDWIESNVKKVNDATQGRVAYVYVPNTAGLGHAYFKRYFFPQSQKEAIIVDERFNGGGQVADYYIDLLRRPYMCSWAYRYGQDGVSPSGAIFGPKVMLIDETAGSGGDLLPWMFRKMKLGTLIGKRTWGGLVGVLGYPILMDGGGITAPNVGFWTEEEGFSVENEGVPPDIEVEQEPAMVMQGHDPQLEKAIEVILEQLKNNPVKKPKRPPFPIRVRK